MKPIGYRDLHGPRQGAYVVRLESKKVGGFAAGLLLASASLLGIGFVAGRATSKAAPATQAPAPSAISRTRETSSASAVPERIEAARTQAPAPEPVLEAWDPSPAARPAAVRATPPVRTATARAAVADAPARPAVSRLAGTPAPSAPPAQWKPPTPFAFVIASFIQEVSAPETATIALRARAQAQVASLKAKGLTRARLDEEVQGTKRLFRVLADERRFYTRDQARERAAALKTEHHFREVWILPL